MYTYQELKENQIEHQILPISDLKMQMELGLRNRLSIGADEEIIEEVTNETFNFIKSSMIIQGGFTEEEEIKNIIKFYLMNQYLKY